MIFHLSTRDPLLNPQLTPTKGLSLYPTFMVYFVDHRRPIFLIQRTFSFDKTVDFSQVPIAVEASSPEIAKQLEALAHKLSPKIIQMTSEQRLVLHNQ